MKRIPRLPSGLKVVFYLALFAVVCFSVGKINVRWDVTQDQRYSLTDGSKALLGTLPRQVTLRYYLSERDNTLPIMLRNYSERIESLLYSVEKAGKGKVNVVRMDPQPNTGALESATIDGIEARSLSSDTNFFMGLSFSSAGGRAVIPFLDPNREQLAEYEIVSQIEKVAQLSKIRVGLISSLPIMQNGRNWNVIKKISETYDIIAVDSKTRIPDDINSVIVVFPHSVSNSFDGIINDFTARGGSLIVLMDSLSHSAEIFQVAKSQSGVISKWAGIERATGLKFSDNNTVLDMAFSSELDRGEGAERLSYVLSINLAGINSEHTITQPLTNLAFVSSGAFQGNAHDELTFTSLLRSTELSKLEPSENILVAGKYENTQLNNAFQADAEIYDMAVIVEGKLRSFTNGSVRPNSKDSKIILIADTDFIADPYTGWTETIQGKKVFFPANHNVALILNSLGYMHGNTALNSARSKSNRSRPLIKLSSLEMDLQKKYKPRMNELSARLNWLLNTGNNHHFDGNTMKPNNVINKSFRQGVENREAEIIQVDAELRALTRGLKEDTTALKTRIKMLNVIIVPALVLICGIFILARRRHRSRAI